MQITRVDVAVPNKITRKEAGSNNQKTNNSVVQGQHQPAFKGGLDSFCLGLANLIENGGLAISFTLQDMLGTNLPRPIMGLKRNAKENKGEANKSFAAKELVREMLTGPSMFLIPMAILKAGKSVVGSAINVPMNFVKSFGEIHAAQPLNEAGKAISKQDFYKNAFAEIIKNAKAETQISKETLETAKSFAERLSSSTGDKKLLKETIGNLADDFVIIAKSHADDAIHTDFTKAAVSATTKAPFKDAVSHMISYADDVVEKVKTQDTSKIKDAIKKLSNQKVITRFGANALMYASVLGFLQIIPRLYNKAEGEDNAGLKGLMKEETLNDNSANTTKTTQNTEAQNKSNPSFGSAASFANTLTGSGTVGKLANVMEFEGCNMSFPLLLGLMAVGILIPRTLQAKDKYDREEILRRDLVTCATMCFAEKELQKGFSKLNETKSGFVLAAKEAGFKNKPLYKRFFDYIRPINGVKVLSTDQIIAKYSNIDKYKDGIKGFCDYIDGQGGKLSKVFTIDKKATEILKPLFKEVSLEKADNATITRILNEAKDSEEVKKLVELFKTKDNPWVTKARTLNARFTALSVLVLVPVFLGFLLPAINERATKKRINEEKAQALAERQKSLQSFNATLLNKSLKENNIFADMAKYTK